MVVPLVPRICVAAVIALLSWPVPSAFSQVDRRDFDLINNTPWKIYYVYARISGTSDWGDDIMEEDTLAAGDKVHIHFSGRGKCMHDIQIGYPNNVAQSWSNIDLCAINTFTVWFDAGKQTYMATWK